VDVKVAIQKRRAYRALVPTNLTPEMLCELGRAAQLAPSCFNKQPWRYVFISEPASLELFHSALPDANSWARDASLIICVISEKSLDCRMKDGREYYQYDAGIASGFIMLRATELGLVAHPMAGYEQSKAKELLEIPPDMSLLNIIAVGKYAGNYKDILNKDDISSEEIRPLRKSLSEFIHMNIYGNPFA